MKTSHLLLLVSLVWLNTNAQSSNKVPNAGLTLPSGFTAIKAADGFGSARHIAVASNGDLFVKA
jgi:hypothetical protein